MNCHARMLESAVMVKFNGHFDGKVIVPDEPVALTANQRFRISVEPIESTTSRFSPHADTTSSIMNEGDTWDESSALDIDPHDATPVDFVRRPGSAAGQIKMSEDFNNTPDDFEKYL